MLFSHSTQWGRLLYLLLYHNLHEKVCLIYADIVVKDNTGVFVKPGSAD